MRPLLLLTALLLMTDQPVSAQFPANLPASQPQRIAPVFRGTGREAPAHARSADARSYPAGIPQAAAAPAGAAPRGAGPLPGQISGPGGWPVANSAAALHMPPQAGTTAVAGNSEVQPGTRAQSQSRQPAALLPQTWAGGTWLYDPNRRIAIPQSGPLPPEAWTPQQRQFWSSLSGYQRSTFNQSQLNYSSGWQNHWNQNQHNFYSGNTFDRGGGRGHSLFNQNNHNQSFYNQSRFNQSNFGYSLHNVVVPAAGTWRP